MECIRYIELYIHNKNHDNKYIETLQCKTNYLPIDSTRLIQIRMGIGIALKTKLRLMLTVKLILKVKLKNQ